MKKALHQLFFVAALMCGVVIMTSCQGLVDAVFGDSGNASGSTTKPVTPSNPTSVTLTTAVDQLKIAQQEGAFITFWFVYQGDIYRAIFKKVDNEYVLQNDVASTRATARGFTRNDGDVMSVNSSDGLHAELNLLDKGGTADYYLGFSLEQTTEQGDGTTKTEAVLQAIIDTKTGGVEQKTENVDNRVVAALAKDHMSGYDQRVESTALNLLINKEVGQEDRRNLADAFNEGVFDGVMVLTSAGAEASVDTPFQLATISEFNAAVNKAGGEENGSLRADVETIADAVVKETKECTEDLGKKVESHETSLEDCYMTEFEVKTKTLNLKIGDSEQLTYSIGPDNADKTIVWSSSDEKVATVDENGKVTAVGTGSADIKGTPKNSSTTLSSSCRVTVTATDETVAVTGVTLNKSELELTIGGSETLTATVAPDNASDKTVSWKSDKTGVATVDENGKVIAVAAGDATITVTTKDGEKAATCKVTVTESTQSNGENERQDYNWNNLDED